MHKSESITEIAKALMKVQSEMSAIPKDSTNPFFKSTYADMATVSEHLMPLLTKHKLSISQTMSPSEKMGWVTEEFETRDGKKVTSQAPYASVIIETILMHESGEWLSSALEVVPAKNDPQGIGSSITYGRRYSLMAIVGAVADEDDDGNKGSKRQDAPESRRPAPQKSQKPQEQAPKTTGKDAKIKKLHAIFSNVKAGDKNYRLFLTDYGVETSKQLDEKTLDEALDHASKLQRLLKELVKDNDMSDIKAWCKSNFEKNNPFALSKSEVEEGLKILAEGTQEGFGFED